MNEWLFFVDIECELIQSSDDELRFHSGTPSDTLMANGVPPIITQQVAT
ncbi:hypothetical protein AO373_0603 [Moraxella catarrhalis]|nr:hypothetical protein AO373_0603 [Moraxella catarrhalis]